MPTKLQPLTVASITAFKIANPSDNTDFSTAIAILQKDKGDYDCPACAASGLYNGDTCHLCDGCGKIPDILKVVTTKTYSLKK